MFSDVSAILFTREGVMAHEIEAGVEKGRFLAYLVFIFVQFFRKIYLKV